MLSRVYREIKDNRSEAIVVDVDYMAHYLADRLFRNNPAEIYLTSSVSFSISDSKQKLHTIFKKYKVNDSKEDTFNELQKCKGRLHEGMVVQWQDVKNAVMHLVVILNDLEDSTYYDDTRLEEVMKAYEGIFAKKVADLLGSFMIRDLKNLNMFCGSYDYKAPAGEMRLEVTRPLRKLEGNGEKETNEAALIFLKYERQYHNSGPEETKKQKQDLPIDEVVDMAQVTEERINKLIQNKSNNKKLSLSTIKFSHIVDVINLLQE
jgi:hypothetical protein